MNSFSSNRNSALAAVLVAALASLLSYGVTLDQQAVYERDVLAASTSAPIVLPEVVVVGRRIEQ
jgi:ABC-type spermidine/putrescine transport system permease subunit II